MFKFKTSPQLTTCLMTMTTTMEQPQPAAASFVDVASHQVQTQNHHTIAEQPPAPLVDEVESRFRVLELGHALQDLWPEDKMEFLTSETTAATADAFYRASLPPAGTPVKLMIVSESPCFTRDDVADMEMNLETLKEAGIVLPEGTPKEHVNLVHCLSYGEPWTLDESTIYYSTKDMKQQYSAGTWPFWKVLATLAGMTDVREDGYDPLESSENVKTAYKTVIGGGASASKKRRQARVLAKHQILEKLREMGIVLIDTSPYAIYMGGGSIWRKNKETGHEYHTPKYQLKGKEYTQLIKTAFELYSGPFVQDVKPDKVLILGKKLEDSLGRDYLENYVQSFGGSLLKTVYHPCANEFFGKNTVTSLQTIRRHAIDARGPIIVPAQPIEEPKVAGKRKKQAPRKSTKKTNKMPSPVVDKESVLVSSPDVAEFPKEIVVTPSSADASKPPTKKLRPSNANTNQTLESAMLVVHDSDDDLDSLYEPSEADKENVAPTEMSQAPPKTISITSAAPQVSEPVQKKGRQSRTSQRTALQTLYNTCKGWSWEVSNGSSPMKAPSVAKVSKPWTKRSVSRRPSTNKRVSTRPSTTKKVVSKPIKKKTTTTTATRASESSRKLIQVSEPTKKVGRQSRNSQRVGEYQCLFNSGKGWAWENAIQ